MSDDAARIEKLARLMDGDALITDPAVANDEWTVRFPKAAIPSKGDFTADSLRAWIDAQRG